MFNCGMTEYINSIPFTGPFTLGALKSNFKFITAPPRDLNQLMMEKKLPVSLMSSLFYLQNKEQFHLISGIGIGSKNKVLSVCLYYPEGLETLDGVTVALDPESSSSNIILQWLLTEVKKQKPRFVQPKNVVEGPFHTAFLLIGDRCLAFGEPKGYKIMDIGEEWLKSTSYPLPFALLAAQKDWAEKYPEEIEHLKDDLMRGISWSMDHRKEIYELAKRQTKLSEEMVLNYWDHLVYIFDYRYRKALDYMVSHLIKQKEGVS